MRPGVGKRLQQQPARSCAEEDRDVPLVAHGVVPDAKQCPALIAGGTLEAERCGHGRKVQAVGARALRARVSWAESPLILLLLEGTIESYLVASEARSRMAYFATWSGLAYSRTKTTEVFCCRYDHALRVV